MKILLIRFSSFGDVLQTLSVVGRLREAFPEAEVHWLTRSEFTHLIDSHPGVKKVWSFNRHEGWRGLVHLTRELRQQNFTHVYDVHNNLRSHIAAWGLNGFLAWRVLIGRHKFLRRSIFRFRRFLLFRFRINLFPRPFSGQGALLAPLKAWGVNTQPPVPPQLFLPRADSLLSKLGLKDRAYVALAPSAAYPLKRWPLEYWRELIQNFNSQIFVVLGGPEDGFLIELEDAGQVLNLAGRLSLLESAQVVAHSRALVTNDTGLMHVAEQTGVACIALMGPAPFGFPCQPRTRIMQLDLKCRPCSKHGQGPCVNPDFHMCLRGIKPSQVEENLREVLG